MTKVNLGCGTNQLPGWINHDMEVDIRNRLPYADRSVDYVFAEHVVEHVTIQEAFSFFEECYRILKPGGIARITVPSIENIFLMATESYCLWLKEKGWGDGTRKGAVKNIVFNHGHQTMWSAHMLAIVMTTVGFVCRPQQVLISQHTELRRLEGHGMVIGDEFNRIESCVVEATKMGVA